MAKKRQAQHVSRDTIFDNMENSATLPQAFASLSYSFYLK